MDTNQTETTQSSKFIQQLRGWVLGKVITLLLKKRSPKEVSLSDRNVDCYSAYLKHKDLAEEALLDKYDKQNEVLSVRMWNPAKRIYEIEKIVGLCGVQSMTVKHHYKGYILDYGDYYNFLKEGVTQWDKCKIWLWYKPKRMLSTFFFNKKDIVFKQRMEVLKLVVDKTLEHKTNEEVWRFDNAYEFTASDLAISSFGFDWYGHPKQNVSKQVIDMYLHSLVSTGELAYRNRKYHITGLAIYKLEQHERDNRRHSDLVNIQKFIAFLTAGLIFVGLCQIEGWRENLLGGFILIVSSCSLYYFVKVLYSVTWYTLKKIFKALINI